MKQPEFNLDEVAMSFARMWRLVDDNGQVWCATDRCQFLALMPSLHCARCLDAAHTRLGIVRPLTPQREQVVKKEKTG